MMFYTDAWFWTAAVFALLFALLLLLRFWNPKPLIQIPELPHHLYFMPDEAREAIAKICAGIGHKPYGTFEVGGANQLLFRNGTTILARKDASTGNELPMLALPVHGGMEDALHLATRTLQREKIHFDRSAVPGSDGMIIRFLLPDFGFGIALKPPGTEMQRHFGRPKFKRWQ